MSTILTKIKAANWLVLFGMIASLALVFLDQSVVPVALPAIKKSLVISDLSLQWVLNAYLLVIAVFIIPGGKLADIYGHKKFFMIGMSLFLVSSCVCAAASNEIWLIIGRIFQGIGAATMLPSSAAILMSVAPPEERGKTMGIYIAVASIFLAIGPMIGGLVTQFLGWRWIFWLNLPFILFSLITVHLSTQSIKDPDAQTNPAIDWLGLIWLILSIAPLTIALLQSPLLGWHSLTLWGLIFTSLISIILFIKAEKNRSHPLLDLQMFSASPIRIGITMVVLTQYAIISIAFWPFFFETVLQFNAGQSGLGLIPVTLPIIFISPFAGQLMDKHGPRLPILLGALCLIAGSIWIGVSAWTMNYWVMLPGLFIFGCGPSFLLASLMTFLFASIHPHKRGTIAGFTSFFRQLGSALGLALTSAILSNAYTMRVTAGASDMQASLFAFTCSTLAIALLSFIILLLLRQLPHTTVRES